jgi:hypothetical protein
MKNNSPQKGQFVRLKTKQKVGLDMATWNINNAQAKKYLYCGYGFKKAVKTFLISSHNFNGSIQIS